MIHLRRPSSPRPLSNVAVTLLWFGLASSVSAQQPAPPTADGPPAADAPPVAATPTADGPWRLDEWSNTPSWLRISGRLRLRWEGIDGQFRAASRLDSSDNYGVSQARLRADINLDGVEGVDLPLGATVEVMDSRHYGAGVGSSMNNSIVNPLDVLQAHGQIDLGRYGEGDSSLRIGRETMDMGSRRLVARNRFRNTINAFDGVHWLWRGDGGTELDAFVNLPVQREPRNFEQAALFDNEMQWDKQDWDNTFWGLFIASDTGIGRTRAEAYVYGLHENASLTRRRQIYTPGFRLLRERRKSDFDYQLESAVQFGKSRLLTSATQDLDHLAWFTHASVGYTFDARWSPNLRVAWDYASGDKDPTDGDNNRFDTLFGARRFEYGPTGIYGAIARSNISTPELRLSVKPAANTDAFVAWRGVWLAESRDFWTTAGVIDPSGASGTHVGNQIEARVRWNIFPKSVRLEVGGAVLLAGSFQDNAPNGQGRDTYYGYTQMIWTF